MTTFAPGFINVESRSIGTGEGSLAVAHIVAISPTKLRDRGELCTVYMDDGREIDLWMSRDLLLQHISEAEGATEVGTSEQYAELSKQLSTNTRRLIAAVQQNTPPPS